MTLLKQAKTRRGTIIARQDVTQRELTRQGVMQPDTYQDVTRRNPDVARPKHIKTWRGATQTHQHLDWYALIDFRKDKASELKEILILNYVGKFVKSLVLVNQCWHEDLRSMKMTQNGKGDFSGTSAESLGRFEVDVLGDQI